MAVTYKLAVLCPECDEEIDLGRTLNLSQEGEVTVRLDEFDQTDGRCDCGATVVVGDTSDIVWQPEEMP